MVSQSRWTAAAQFSAAEVRQGVGAARSAEVRTMLDDSSFPRDN
jgi:hypothetical protein